MDLTLSSKLLIAAIAIMLGGLPIGLIVSFLYHAILPRRGEYQWEGFGWLVLYIGATERLATIGMFVFAPQYLSVFIGGWFTAKYAAQFPGK